MKNGMISYRFATVDDLEQIIALWVAETEWGVFPFTDTERWVNAPAGVPRTVVACDNADGKIVGQFGFVPTLILVGDRELRGVRPHSTIVGKRWRDAVTSMDPADQPGFAMYRYGMETMAAEGVQVAHMLPNPRWLRLLKLFPGMQTAQFPLWSISFPLSSSVSLANGWSTEPLTGWNQEIDQLWAAASHQYHCGVVRNAKMLEWKTTLEGSTVVTVRRNGELRGLASCRMKGDRQWTISDMLTADADESLRATLMGAVREGAGHSDDESSEPDQRPVKAAVLATPLMQPVLAQLGFTRDNYQFPFVVQRLDPALTDAEIDPRGWYVAATD